MRNLLSIAMVLSLPGAVVAAEEEVQARKLDDTIQVSVGGAPFAVYNLNGELPKPFFSPVRGPDGTIISRPIEKPDDDHPHHKGIWNAVDEVNDVDFWAEQGKIQNVSVRLQATNAGERNPGASVYWKDALRRYKAAGGHNLAGNSGEKSLVPDKSVGMQVINHWLGKDGNPVVTEKTLIRMSATSGGRLVSYDITFTAGKQNVTFGDTKEGMFGFRMIDSMRETEGGHVVNADGLEGAGACWGRVSDWVDYYGKVEGKTFGVAIFDHPLNFRRSRYHVRNYGLFTISPFGERAYTRGKRPADPLILLAGKSVRLRYGLFIHAGDTNSADVAGKYVRYLTSSH